MIGARVEVLRVVAGGEGLGHLPDGRAVFLPGALPGDVVRVDAMAEKARWARATRLTLLASSPQRVESPCALFARCGGCDWMGWDEDAQRAARAGLVAEALRRTGRLAADVPPLEPAVPTLGRRGRVRLAVDARARALGFRARGAHEVVDVPRCPMAADAVNAALTDVRAVVGAHEDAAFGIEELELRAAPAGAPVVLRLHLRGPLRSAPGAVRALVAALAEILPTFVDGEGADGRADPRLLQRWPLPGATVEASPRSFTQVRDDVGAALVGAVLDAVGALGPGRTVFDGCCGVGNFLLPLRAAGHGVDGADASPDAVADARAGAAAAGLSGPGPDVERLDEALARRATGAPPDVVVLDPPRAGAGRAVVPLLRLAPRRVVYVACDPVSLARDARTLAEGGYALSSIRCFDLFPHTHHVETLAVFDRARA